MQTHDAERQAQRWRNQMSVTKSAHSGAMVRRSLAWVDRQAGRDAFALEGRRRGYHLEKTADQFIVACHNGPNRTLF